MYFYFNLPFWEGAFSLEFTLSVKCFYLNLRWQFGPPPYVFFSYIPKAKTHTAITIKFSRKEYGNIFQNSKIYTVKASRKAQIA